VALFHSLRHRRLPLFFIHGLEEAAWIANRNIRESLGIALTGVLRDNEITPAHAVELARMVIRGNAESLTSSELGTMPQRIIASSPSSASRLLWMTGYGWAEQGDKILSHLLSIV
jgi:hypothetical protein